MRGMGLFKDKRNVLNFYNCLSNAVLEGLFKAPLGIKKINGIYKVSLCVALAKWPASLGCKPSGLNNDAPPLFFI